MFDGFVVQDPVTDRGPIHVRVGGSGPPLLALHGYPETHLMWHGCAEELARRFTVVAADLPGYGDSHRPVPANDRGRFPIAPLGTGRDEAATVYSNILRNSDTRSAA